MLLPHTFLLQTAKEPLNQAILFGRIRRNELLLEAILPTRPPKASTLKDQAVVAPENRRGYTAPLERETTFKT